MSVTTKSTKFYSGFTPQSIPGLTLWLDATDVNGNGTSVATGTTLTSWKDKSGYGNHVTAYSNVTTYRTTGISTKGSVYFNNSYFTGGFATAFTGVSITSFIVASTTSSSANFARFLSLGRPGVQDNVLTSTCIPFVKNAGLAEVYAVTNSIGTGKQTITYGSPFLSQSYFNATTFGINLNGGSTFATASSPSSFNITSYALGTNTSGVDTASYLVGEICEILCFFGSALTTSQGQQVEGYLAFKWGLRANLPAAQPYKTIPTYQRAFQPVDISGCALWFDGADQSALALTGTTITQWNDKSGNARHAVAVGSPTYNASGRYIQLNGTSQNFRIPTGGAFMVGTYFTFFIVERKQTLSGLQGTAFFGQEGTGSTNAGLHIRYAATGTGGDSTDSTARFGFFLNDLDATTGITGFTTAAAQPVRVWSFPFTPSFRAIYLNGTLLSSDTNNTQLTGMGIPTIGQAFLGASYGPEYYGGFIYEVLCFTGNVPAAQRQQVESYLANKWGLVASLPSTHPFKLVPTLTTAFTPRSITTLALWLDFNDLTKIVYSGTSITQVTDKSAGAYVFTPVGGVLLDSAQIKGMTTCSLPLTRLTTTSFPWSTKFTIFFVIKSGGNFLFSQQDTNADPYSGYRNYIWFGNNPMASINAVFSGSDSVAGVNPTIANNWAIVELAYANSTTLSSLRVNGTARSVTTGTATGLATVTTNLWINGNRNYFQGYDSTCFIGEILMFSDSLPLNDLYTVEGYLAQRWKLSTLLPATHPFKKIAP